MSFTLRLPLLALGLCLLGALAWPLASFARIYRFERRFYAPPPHAPRRPPELPGLRDVAFDSADGARIAAWYQPPRAPGGALIVLAHASLGDRAELAPQALWLSAAGYGVLLLDWPGHGESTGRVTCGPTEAAALRAALDWLTSQPELASARIGGLGCSMGAYLLLVGAASDARLQAVVAEGAPSDLVELAHWQYRRRAPWGPQAALLAARHAGADLSVTSAVRDVARIAPRAVLLIVGERDEVVAPDMGARLYAAAGEPRELWQVAGAGHCDTARREPEEYRRRVLAFFARSFGATP